MGRSSVYHVGSLPDRRAGVRKADLLSVVRGGQMTPAQAEALSPILNLDPTALLARPAAPEELIEEASRPSWYEPRHSFTRAHEMSDPEGLAAITHKAQFPVAARKHATMPGPDWRSKVAWVLADYLDTRHT